MTQQYAKIGEYTRSSHGGLCGPILANFDGKKA